jgi:hypothetical protein
VVHFRANEVVHFGVDIYTYDKTDCQIKSKIDTSQAGP